MKKSSCMVMTCLAFVVNVALPVYAQTDAAAKSLLDKVSRTYAGYKTVQAEFSLAIRQAQQVTHTESGRMVMDKPTGRYHITTSSQDIISDGKTQWMVMKDVREVQVTEVAPASGAISPANIFSFYKEGYKYVSAADEQADSQRLAVVELTPEDTHAPYFKIKLRIDENTYQIRDVTIFDKGGNQFVYTIRNTRSNAPVTESQFVFRQADYPNYEMVDLR